ncbi:Serine/threonine-protein kinase/endoribonuclease IRE1 [Orchesella cincta]|uniref:Serine/threonine-protein kinase/endoribonuclease IRE1 n=1 Tax=Orchesella cincta TaxID=48709 RepID=A0A1D2M813_ORCCI|nr:Serine/threonine-protein kinase/endoribonuclease IRE1 [Orchesella cincta]
MEDWEKKIILQNMDKLVETTQCSSVLLAKLLAHGILSVNDAEELNSMKGNSTEQALELYNILLTRQHGFKTLLQALDKTKQTGALSILTKETTTEYMISFTYDVKSVIGGHNESIVYKGRFGNRDVAVKKLLLKVIDAETVSHEIEILKNCDAHQNIVRYFGSKKTPSSILIFLELCDTNLSEWVKHKSVDILPMEVLRQATLGLEWLHSKRIVHRSLKPENVLLSRNASQVKISDFVLSKSILGETSYESSSLKFGWNAPETFSQLVDQKHRKPDFVRY